MKPLLIHRPLLRTILTTLLALLAPPLAAAQSEALRGLVNIRFQNDVRVFAVMAALNAAGFDDESDGQEMSETRRAVRDELARLDPDLRHRLGEFYLSHLEGIPVQEQPQTAYTSLALLLSGPPQFELQAEADTIPEDARHVQGFERLAGEVYRVSNLANLWERLRPAYERELLQYEPILRDIIREALDYFRVPARVVLDRGIILIPDLLDKKDIVNARNLERVYYIVVGPSDSPWNNRRQLQHEYLHFLVDPLVRKFGAPLMEHEKLLDLAQAQPRIRSQYQHRYLLMVTESLIESLQLSLSEPSDSESQRAMVDAFRQGLILMPYFLRGLRDYEQSEMVSLPTFMESLLAGVDSEAVRRDEAAIAQLENELRDQDEARRARIEEAEARARQRREEGMLFQEATDHLRQGELNQAEAKLNQLLAGAPEHGGAWFYLAQIAFQREDYGAALEAYRKSSVAADSVPWVRAWSLVRMGRILAARGETQEARRLFESVQQLDGDLQGARDLAAESLALLERQP